MGLSEKTAALARSAPQQWREFLAELAVEAEKKKDECVRAPVEVLQVTQGRAQQITALLDLFRKASK